MNLNLYDRDLNRIAVIGGQYISCFWSEGYNTTENFSVELIETDEYKKKIREDCYIGRDDRNTLMVIKTVQIANGKIVASGKQATRLLEDVAFVGEISSGAYIDKAIKNAYNSSSKYHNVEFTESDLQIAYNEKIGNKSFLELATVMCQSTDVGFRCVKNGKKIFAEFYQPKSKENLVFSEKFGNIFVSSVSLSTEKYKNYAIVLGGGDGKTKTIVSVDATGGGERREIIIDAGSTTKESGETDQNYKARLAAVGMEKIVESQKIFECAFSPSVKDFGTKYDLGDVLTIYLTEYGIVLQARVARFSQKAQGNKIDTTVEVGKIIFKR